MQKPFLESLVRVRGIARVLAASCVSVLALGACASAPSPRSEVPRQLSPSEEAELIAAAKRHPIATTYERPRTDQLPVAPPKIPPEPAAPPPQAEAPAPPRDQVVVVGNEPAPSPQSYVWPDTSYPTYSTTDRQVWVDGPWVARPSWHGYYETPWVGVGVGVGRPWGWSVGVGVGRPWGWGSWGYHHHYPYSWGYRPRTWVAPPHVHVAPRARYNDHWHGRSSGYPSSSRRQVYVAPPASVHRGPAVTARPRSAAPVYRAPPATARPRSAAPVYRAPPATARPRSAAPVYRAPAAAPRSGGSSSGGRRTVHVR